MSGGNRSFGQTGEFLAEGYLVGLGFQIVERNFKCQIGEIDIVAKDGNTLVFIEVKTRTSYSFGLPEEAVTTRKIRKIARVGDYYRSCHLGLPEASRIDVVAVEPTSGKIRVIKNVTG